MNKVFVSGGNRYGENQLLSKYGYTFTPTVEEADIVLFTGGADLDPELYNQPLHAKTYPQAYRDAEDILNYQKALAEEKLLFGICRGAQFLCVMAGGYLIQDISSHTTSHNMVVVQTGEIVATTSAHHQLMVPPSDAIIVATSPHECDAVELDGNGFKNVKMKNTPEVVLFPSIRALAVQGHPEFQLNAPQFDRFRDLCMAELANMIRASSSIC